MSEYINEKLNRNDSMNVLAEALEEMRRCIAKPSETEEAAATKETAKTTSERETRETAATTAAATATTTAKQPESNGKDAKGGKSATAAVVKDLAFLVAKVAAIMAVFVILFTYIFGFVRYQDPSMAPAVKDGDLVVYYRYNSRGYLPQDVTVLDYKGQTQIRRVVATAGDVVDITEAGLLVNGALQQEPNISEATERYANGVEFPLTVPENSVFLLGDSRMNATDSRVYGSVEIGDTMGKVMTVIRRRGI